ncbi:MAG: damage-inducible protein CinA [Chlamydiales bacterium]|jgi:PncC family amidohydrolase|nr:damage-inducible protein CinA [Chlamydiales bacterium]
MPWEPWVDSSLSKSAEGLLCRLIEKKWRIAFAESCTGGAAASHLINLPSASLAIESSFIAYSESAKKTLLHVKEETIAQFSVVSEQVAEEMAAGALLLSQSDVAAATTGFAGPSGGSPSAPVGTVCFAMQRKGSSPISWRAHFSGNRKSVIDQAVCHLYQRLFAYLELPECPSHS